MFGVKGSQGFRWSAGFRVERLRFVVRGLTCREMPLSKGESNLNVLLSKELTRVVRGFGVEALGVSGFRY